MYWRSTRRASATDARGRAWPTFACPAVLLLAAACAAPRAASEPGGLAALSPAELETRTLSRTPPPTSACSQVQARALPPVHLLFDTAAVLRAARDVEASGYTLYSMHVDTAGGAFTHLVESTLPDDVRERISEAFGFALIAGRDTTSHFFRARVDVGSDARLRIVPSVTCRPQLLTVPQVQAALMHRAGIAVGRGAPAGRHSTTVWLHVMEDGSPGAIEVRASTGHRVVDELIVEALRVARFSGAFIDGRRVDVWVEIPVLLDTTQLERQPQMPALPPLPPRPPPG